MSFLSKLYFGWSAYFNADWRHPDSFMSPPPDLVDVLRDDGINLLSVRMGCEQMQCIIGLNDRISPQFMAQRLKGRWNHALRGLNVGFPGFKRRFFIRSLGQNTKDVVMHYIQSQVDKSDLVDPLFRESMKKLRFHQEATGVDKNSHKALYDLYVHIIFVTADRYRMFEPEARKVLIALKSGMQEKEVALYEASMMPDHVHCMVRWPSAYSAVELLEGIKQASGCVMHRAAFWSGGGYVGTVGPYSLKVALEQNRCGGWIAA